MVHTVIFIFTIYFHNIKQFRQFIIYTIKAINYIYEL